MPRQEILTTDLQRPIRLQELRTDLFLHDKKGNLITVVVTDGGADYIIAGNVVCYMIRPDSSTLTIAGTADDNQAMVELPEAAYLYPGRASFVIKEETTTEAVTLAAFTAIIYRDRSDRVVDNDRIIPSLDEIMTIVNQINDMTVSVTTLAAGSAATAVLGSQSGHYTLALGIPRGISGVEPAVTSVTLLASGWSNDAQPTQTITVSGISVGSHIFVSIANTVTADQYIEASLARILCTSQGTDQLTFTAYGVTPTLDLPVTIINLSESGDGAIDYTQAEIEEILTAVFGEEETTE